MYKFMRIKILLICIVLFFVAFNVAVAENENLSNSNVSSSGNVIKNIKNSNNLYIEKIGTYSLEKDGCAIYWEVSVHKDNKEKNITLRTRQPIGVKCTYPFVKQLPLHRKIFSEIFKDWEKQQFHTLFIGPLYRLDPGNTWNIRIAMASADSSDWVDWCKNYPNHSIGKSSNQIFVELANQVDAYRELVSLFKEFGLKIELNSVEKVFGKKAKDLPFYQELKSRGLEGNHRLIYDAGMIYFSISLLN
jgi:hypothetical protein